MSTQTAYGLDKQLDISYEEAIERVTAVLKTEGFGVLTTIDMKATLKKKLGVDFRKYSILGACNPMLANQALHSELNVGLLLPCNVIVYEQDNGEGAVVSIVDPHVMLGVVPDTTLQPIADEARIRLVRVLEAL